MIHFVLWERRNGPRVRIPMPKQETARSLADRLRDDTRLTRKASVMLTNYYGQRSAIRESVRRSTPSYR
jgi:hypothetical protein